MEQPAVVSSSSFTYEWTYDVFLSFRGEDTRYGFTSNLYNSLDQKGIQTFIDDEKLRRGEEIRPALLKAIQDSRIVIIVFSKNYADSTFCLDELVKIIEHFEAESRLVWPIFYDVDPSEIRHQHGSYAEALEKHEGRFQHDKSKIQKWREALHKAANLSGWHFKQGSEHEYKFIANIVSNISKIVNHTPSHVADNPVGLGPPTLEVTSLMGLTSNEGVDMVGICGIGGIGKTTIARAVYNIIAYQFDGLCFLANIREMTIHKHGLAQLQETLLFEILGENIRIGDVSKGISLIKRRLQRKKVLLILDDVDNLKQLKALVGGYDWFGPGSRIIITSRDKHLLSGHGVEKFYDVKELNKKQALELFSWNAFKSNKVNPDYADISSRVLCYAGGLPLALEVMGSNLYDRSIDEWNSALDKYERIPINEIHEILKVSYDYLEVDEKNIFLDIACFFNRVKKSYVNEMLHVRGFHPEHGIQVLIDKSLMKIDSNDCVRMHGLIQDMGREIVRRESEFEPGERSRLWFDEDIIEVLQNDTGSNKIGVIALYSSKQKVQWNGKAFKKMRNLRVLIVGDAQFSIAPKHFPNSLRVLEWSEYPSPSLPSDFHPNRLVILSLPDSCFKLDKSLKMFDSLSFMDFENCKFLRQVPDLSGLPNLRALCLDKCTNLIEVHNSVGFLDKLILLSAQGCISLHTFLRAIYLPSLETLDLRWCTSLQSFPEVLEMMENIREVYLDHTAIKELPFSIHHLIGLERLFLRRCTNLNLLPSSIRLLPKLEVIIVYKERGFQLCEPCEVQEGAISKVFMFDSLNVSAAPLSPAYSTVASDKDVIHRHPLPGNITSPEERIIGRSRSRSSVSFWFRRRFPDVGVLFVIEPIDKDMHGSLLQLRFCALKDGISLFSSSCYYVISETTVTKPSCLRVSLGDDLQCHIAQLFVNGVFPEHEWSHFEVSFQLKYHNHSQSHSHSHRHRPYAPPNWGIAATIKRSTLRVYKKNSCIKDIRLSNPDYEDNAASSCCYCNDRPCEYHAPEWTEASDDAWEADFGDDVI